jgi:hypothetical protein
MPPNTLTKREAVEFLGIDEKTFDNFFKNAEEFVSLPRPNDRGRFKFAREALEQWLEGYRWRTVELTQEDYARCLDFALAMHFRGYVASDWGTGRQREFGQKISNWMRGQLGEVAVQKFLSNEFATNVELDFQIHEEIVPQDFIGISENGRTREPRIGVGIKASKPKSSYLVLSKNETERSERRSDVYIFCRPDLPDDHLLRISSEKVREIVENQQLYGQYRELIPDFESIPCEIAGWCNVDELESVTSIPGQDFDGERFVIKTGRLHKDNDSWQELINRL